MHDLGPVRFCGARIAVVIMFGGIMTCVVMCIVMYVNLGTAPHRGRDQLVKL